jgi:hypothetical protein
MNWRKKGEYTTQEATYTWYNPLERARSSDKTGRAKRKSKALVFNLGDTSKDPAAKRIIVDAVGIRLRSVAALSPQLPTSAAVWLAITTDDESDTLMEKPAMASHSCLRRHRRAV